MATDDRSAKFSDAFSGAASRQGLEQEKILQELQRQARQDALARGGLLVEFFQTLPAAALASHRAEYERIVKRYGKDHPRSQGLEESLDRLERTEVQAARGRARAARALEVARMPGAAFHGFVTDAAGEPLQGMTVQVSSLRQTTGLEARTAQDGYFRIALPQAAAAKEAREQESEPAEVVILDGQGKRVHEDPVPLELRAGSAYREYSLASTRGEPDRKEAPTAAKRAPRRGKRGRTP